MKSGLLNLITDVLSATIMFYGGLMFDANKCFWDTSSDNNN